MRSLVAAGGFDIRIVTRSKVTNFTSAADIQIVTVDFSSLDSISQAFEGCDVVVNAMGDRVSNEHVSVLRAAISAGVKRYVPSQWGNTPRTDATLAIPFMRKKLEIAELTEKAALDGKISFTSFSGGPWIEYVMTWDTMMSVPKGTFYVHEFPDFEIGLTSRALFGNALVAALQKLEDTKNKYLYIELVRLSQNRALQLTKEALPKLEVKIIPTSFRERYKSGLSKLIAGGVDGYVFADVLSLCIFDPETNPAPTDTANGLLGLTRATDEEVRDMVRGLSTFQSY